MNARSVKRTLHVLAVALAAAGCSSGDGGGGGAGSAAIAGATSASATTIPMAVTLHGPKTAVKVGDPVEIALSASQVTSLYGAGVDLAYDPALLELRGVSDGGFLPGATAAGGLRAGTPGIVTVAASAEGASPGATGSGDVLVVRFVAKASGKSQVSPVELIVEDAAGNQGSSPSLGPVTVQIN